MTKEEIETFKKELNKFSISNSNSLAPATVQDVIGLRNAIIKAVEKLKTSE